MKSQNNADLKEENGWQVVAGLKNKADLAGQCATCRRMSAGGTNYPNVNRFNTGEGVISISPLTQNLLLYYFIFKGNLTN